ncbi:coiled-coil-helix-coiled-coil-helix domain-containing protein 7 [Neodiprion lecontei]|uniref:Coiled-coil-helix-coiled-coil-helix domain-containing protein 7 n=1 Tax=Neodiprion lecontei TaxID=441921 RepID=A0A6J0C253_NEOLC|nr:coiled-coil-helix-coiled-coil-helix domain-containing protein 7 [Neodiprion lecontei]XP_046471409.1 coiled-coil-helix-coiled-coil-helix domain-containing protein 7 [Neodiprion pinetum]
MRSPLEMSTADEQIERQKKRNDTTRKRSTKLDSEENNPCLKEHHLSLKCLNENNADHDACTLYFMNYKNCKDFWYQVTRERRKNGIKPYLPPPADRLKIKGEYLKANSPK